MRAFSEATANVFNDGADPRASPCLGIENVAEEKRRHREKHEEHADHAVPVRKTCSACEGPNRKTGHERGHARDPPLDAIAALQKVSADAHEAHEVSADSGHQQQVTDKHNVIDYV